MYSGKVKEFLKKRKVSEGDFVKFVLKGVKYCGILLPNEGTSSTDSLMIKQESGYNVGINYNDVECLTNAGKKATLGGVSKFKDLKFNKQMPNVSLVATGGTISSRVDYKTGGVYMLMEPNEILKTTPELVDIINLDAIESPFRIGSEDMSPDLWSLMADIIAKRFNKGDVGVIVTHGTDTLHYTSSALSFLLKDFQKPIALVGAQRSPDRGSFDGSMNLICAAQYVTSDIAETAIVMHGTMNDDFCFVNRGTKVRKMHTSRRDAFRPINTLPLAKIWPDGKKEVLNQYRKRDDSVKAKVCGGFENKVAIISAYPGADPEIIDYYVDKGYKGIIISSTALGHVPGYTQKKKDSWLPVLKRAVDSGVFVGNASQTIYGRVHPHVYRQLIELEQMGIVFLEDLLVETAYVKLMWALSQTKDLKRVKEIMLTNYVGEFNQRIVPEAFLY